jgi:hypothetical protein
VAHGATHFTRNALYREQQNADGSDESASVKVDNTQVQSIPAMGRAWAWSQLALLDQATAEAP